MYVPEKHVDVFLSVHLQVIVDGSFDAARSLHSNLTQATPVAGRMHGHFHESLE